MIDAPKRNKQRPHVFPMRHHKSSDGLRAVPWQHVLALSILELMMHLDSWLTAQMQVSSWQLRPLLGATSRIVRHLQIRLIQVDGAD